MSGHAVITPLSIISAGDYRDNPLGTGGVLAKRYGELIDDLWTGNSKSITPLKFRVSKWLVYTSLTPSHPH